LYDFINADEVTEDEIAKRNTRRSPKARKELELKKMLRPEKTQLNCSS